MISMLGLNSLNLWLKAKWQLAMVLLSMCGLQLPISCLQAVYGQISSPVVQQYTFKDFNAHPWMWGGVQDKKGNLFFANNDGVLVFDGARWQLLETPTPVRSISVDSSNIIYVGCVGDFGLFEPAPSGRSLVFKSLRSFLPEKLQGTYNINGVYNSADGIFFLSSSEKESKLYRAKRKDKSYSLKYWNFPEKYISAGATASQFFIIDPNVGLQVLSGDKFGDFPGGNQLIGSDISGLAAIDKQSFVLGSMSKGLYIGSSQGLNKIAIAAQGQIDAGKGIMGLTVLPNGHIAIAITDGGVLVVDQNGNTMQSLTTANGLLSNNMVSICSDRQGGVWAGTSNGISYFNPLLPITSISNEKGLSGKITSIYQQGNVLYVGTMAGLFTLDVNNPSQFVRVPGLNDDARSIIPTTSGLLLASGSGAYAVSGTTVTQLTNQLARIIGVSKRNPNQAYAALQEGGVTKLSNTGGVWAAAGNIDGLTEQINSIAEDKEGNVWMGTTYQGLIYFNANSNKVQRHDIEQGFKATGKAKGYVFVQRLGDEVVFRTDKGIFRRQGSNYELVPGLSKVFSSRMVKYVDSGPNQGVVFWQNKAYNIKFDGQFNVVMDSLSWANLTSEIIDAMHVNEQFTWIGHQDQVIRAAIRSGYPAAAFKAQVRLMEVGNDSIYYTGFFWDKDNIIQIDQTEEFTPSLNYQYNTVKFIVGSNSYLNSRANEYQFFLEGFDESWSHWQKTPEIKYNLREGKYKLLVRAKNAIGQVSEVDSFEFRVKPPIYRTIWAYLLYILAGGGAVFGLIKLNTARLKRQNKKLEEIVDERTREVNEQKNKLEVQNKEIIQAYDELSNTQDQLVQSEKMAALGQLIASIAHEINTPLGAIGGASSNLNKSMPTLINNLPEFINKLSPELKPLVYKMVDRSLGFTGSLTSREERQFRKMAAEFLETNQIGNANELAKDMIRIGLWENLDEFLPIFKHANVSEILELIGGIGRIRVNLDNIGLAVAKTQKIVFALKSYSHKQAFDELVSASIIDTVDTVLILYSNQLKHGIVLKTNYDRTLPNTFCYPDELHQVWTNIIHNALQAMDNQGELTIDVIREQNNIVVKITDSGPGIPEHVLPKIFEAFYTTKKQGEGSGLGLNICYKIIQKHDGDINVDTEPGRTTFIVTLPIKTEAAVPERAATA
jgi:two-component system, NtrC family, sensor kinase